MNTLFTPRVLQNSVHRLYESAILIFFCVITMIILLGLASGVSAEEDDHGQQAIDSDAAETVPTLSFDAKMDALRVELAAYPFTAEGIVVMDAETGYVLYEQNGHNKFYPASTTKIVTALLALEYEDTKELVRTSEKARYVGGSRIFLALGEQKPLDELVYGLMLNSGNDAAIAIAEHIGGSVSGFASMMNAKAKQAGAKNTHFVNPHGLHDDQHITTPLDLAKIGQMALQNETLREVASTKNLKWVGEDWDSELWNTNKLLWRFEGTTGLKTGYTHYARQTFVGSAQQGDVELIVVLMKAHSREQLWSEAIALFNTAFKHYDREQYLHEQRIQQLRELEEQRQRQLLLQEAEERARQEELLREKQEKGTVVSASQVATSNIDGHGTHLDHDEQHKVHLEVAAGAEGRVGLGKHSNIAQVVLYVFIILLHICGFWILFRNRMVFNHDR